MEKVKMRNILSIDVKSVMYKLQKFWNENKDTIIRYAFLIIVFIFGIIMRVKLFPKISGDMKTFLTKWYEYIQEHGGFACVGDKIGDYTPIYYYFMAALTYTKLPVHIGIKWISIIFDIIISVYVMKIVKLNECKYSFNSAIAFAVTFCLPTVVLNSAAWGQCDVIYVCFLIMSLYYILKGDDRLAMIMFGISFAFKLQSIFFVPLLAILIIKRKIRWRMVIWIPVVYFISIIPALLAGGDFIRLLTIYFSQTDTWKWIVALLPNIWMLFGNRFINTELAASAVYFSAIIIMCFVYYYGFKKDLKITQNTLISLAALSSFIVPFVLPKMHERYMFLTEIMFVIFAFYNRKYIWLIVTTQFCSIQGILKYLYGVTPMDMRLLTLLWIVNAVVAFYILRDEMNHLKERDELIMKFEVNCDIKLSSNLIADTNFINILPDSKD